ncbi:unnamed protein product [Cladocopium goreaui]|uniref:Neurofilament heavy polypeptide n=1 Tax=Cladocopium goreaui TaxID=2562237 RepID=A0A9P1DL37_9DINO|nr:unnamed protein product [Cladocopium goreaui]
MQHDETLKDIAAIDIFSGQASVSHAYRQETEFTQAIGISYVGIFLCKFHLGHIGHACMSVSAAFGVRLPGDKDFKASFPQVNNVMWQGFLRLVQMALRVVEDGVAHGGPPCSSFIWLNRGTSKRSAARPMGDQLEPTDHGSLGLDLHSLYCKVPFLPGLYKKMTKKKQAQLRKLASGKMVIRYRDSKGRSRVSQPKFPMLAIFDVTFMEMIWPRLILSTGLYLHQKLDRLRDLQAKSLQWWSAAKLGDVQSFLRRSWHHNILSRKAGPQKKRQTAAKAPAAAESPTSEASTVPGTDEQARAMAIQKYQQAQREESARQLQEQQQKEAQPKRLPATPCLRRVMSMSILQQPASGTQSPNEPMDTRTNDNNNSQAAQAKSASTTKQQKKIQKKNKQQKKKKNACKKGNGNTPQQQLTVQAPPANTPEQQANKSLDPHDQGQKQVQPEQTVKQQEPTTVAPDPPLAPPSPAQSEQAKAHSQAQATAVKAMLNRAQTADLGHSAPPAPSAPALPAPATPSSTATPMPTSDLAKDPLMKKKKGTVVRNKDAHNRRMRFYRSLESSSSPDEIQDMAENARTGGNKRQKLAVLFEEWVNCSEDWPQSSFVIRMKQRTTERQKGGRRWMTKADIVSKYAPGRTESEAKSIAEEIVAHKEQTPDAKRPHPDAPLNSEMTLYLVWDEQFESTEHDSVVEQLFRQKDSSAKKASKGKGSKESKKRKASSSPENSEDSSEDSDRDDSSSSSSSTKRNKKQHDKKKKRKNTKNKKTKKGKTAKKDKGKKNKSESVSDVSDSEDKDPEAEEKEREKAAEKERKRAEAEAKKEAKRIETEQKKAANKEQNRKKGLVKKEVAALDAAIGDSSRREANASTLSVNLRDAVIQDLQAHRNKLMTKRGELQAALDFGKVSDMEDLAAQAKALVTDYNRAKKATSMGDGEVKALQVKSNCDGLAFVAQSAIDDVAAGDPWQAMDASGWTPWNTRGEWKEIFSPLDPSAGLIFWKESIPLNLAFQAKYPSCSIDGGPLPPGQAARAGQNVVEGGRKFAITEVVKKDGSLMMTAKAYNGRCILEWLHDAMGGAIANRSFSDERTPLAYLSPQQAQDFHAAAQTYIDAHIELTRLSCLCLCTRWIGGKPHWIIRPKIHVPWPLQSLGHQSSQDKGPMAELMNFEMKGPLLLRLLATWPNWQDLKVLWQDTILTKTYNWFIDVPKSNNHLPCSYMV